MTTTFHLHCETCPNASGAGRTSAPPRSPAAGPVGLQGGGTGDGIPRLRLLPALGVHACRPRSGASVGRALPCAIGAVRGRDPAGTRAPSAEPHHERWWRGGRRDARARSASRWRSRCWPRYYRSSRISKRFAGCSSRWLSVESRSPSMPASTTGSGGGDDRRGSSPRSPDRRGRARRSATASSPSRSFCSRWPCAAPASAPAGWPCSSRPRREAMMHNDGCSRLRRVALVLATIWLSG